MMCEAMRWGVVGQGRASRLVVGMGLGGGRVGLTSHILAEQPNSYQMGSSGMGSPLLHALPQPPPHPIPHLPTLPTPPSPVAMQTPFAFTPHRTNGMGWSVANDPRALHAPCVFS